MKRTHIINYLKTKFTFYKPDIVRIAQIEDLLSASLVTVLLPLVIAGTKTGGTAKGPSPK